MALEYISFQNVFCFNGRDDEVGQNDTFSTLTILSRQQQSAHNLLDITPSRAFHENIIAGQMIMIQGSPILARIKSPKKPSPKKPSPKKPSPKKPQSPIRTSGENRQDKQYDKDSKKYIQCTFKEQWKRIVNDFKPWYSLKWSKVTSAVASYHESNFCAFPFLFQIYSQFYYFLSLLYCVLISPTSHTLGFIALPHLCYLIVPWILL